MAANPQVIVEYIAKTDKLAAGSQAVGAQTSKAGQLARKAFLPAVAALAAIGVAANAAGQAASALNEQISASNVVFGKNARSMQAWAKTGAKAFGLSTTESLKAANAYGNMFATVGLGAGDVSKMSRSMVQLAGDMASFHDQDPGEMLQRLRSGLSGEAEPLRQFGVLISEAAVKQEAYRSGIAKAGSTLTEAQKVQARFGLIMKQTGKAQGDFARTADSVANRQRTAAAETENLKATLGQALLPVMKTVIGAFSAVIGFLTRYPGVLQAVVAGVAALAVAIIALNVAMTVMAIITGPISIWFVVAAVAIAALIAVVIVLVKNWDALVGALKTGFGAIKSAAGTVFDWLRSNWPLILGILTGPFGLAVALIIRYWDQVKGAATTALNAVRSILGGFAGWIVGVARQITSPLGWISDALGAIGDAAVAAVGIVKAQLGRLAGWILDLVGSIRGAANAVAGAIKGPLNAVINAWNSLRIPGFSIKLPSVKIAGHKIGGGSLGWGGADLPNIPTLARGGVVSSPTLALIGEGRGREVVAPEDLLRAIVADAAPEVRVFIGETELRSMVRFEVHSVNDRTAQVLLAGLR